MALSLKLYFDHLFYIIIVMIINLELLDSTFDYKSIHIKFVS